jgi:hypothetical protein
VVLALGVALCWICLLAARQIMDWRRALVATWLYLVLIFSKPLNATHHWFSTLAIMCAVVVLMRERRRIRILIAGVLLGLASFFTQTHGAAAALGLSAFVVWEQIYLKRNWRGTLVSSALLSLSFAASVLLLNAYFIATVGARHLWYEQVTYVRLYAPRMGSISNFGLPAFSTWRAVPLVAQQLFVYFLLPVIYVLSLLRSRLWSSDSASERYRNAALLSLVGTVLLLEVAISPNWLRIYAVSMPGIILLLWYAERGGKPRRYMIGLFYCGIACLALRQIWSRHHQQYVVCELPAGRAAVLPQNCDELLWIAQRTKPGDFFFQAAWPGMYIPLGLRNPLFLDAVGPNQQTRPEDVKLAIDQLDQKSVRYVLWSKRLDTADVDPKTENSLGPLKAYLLERYELVKVFSGEDELWERK